MSIEFKETDTLKTCKEKFYDIMRKYDIKQGTPRFDEKGKQCGRIANNFEWTMCYNTFIARLGSHLTLESIFTAPKDLQQ